MQVPSQPASVPRGRHNIIDVSILTAAIVAVVYLAAWSIAGLTGLAAITLLLSAVLFFDPHISAQTTMRAYGGELQPITDSQLSSLVDVLAWRAGIDRRPDFYVIPSLTLNAFSAGTKDKPAIAVTEGLLRRLSLRETAGIVAHEMSHIRNGDLAVFRLADILTKLSQMSAYVAILLTVINLYLGIGGDELTSWLVVALLYAMPLVTNILQDRMSRDREYNADREAVALTGDTAGFISALRHIDRHQSRSRGSIFDDLMLPVPGRRIPHPSLLRSPPPMLERIAELNGHSPPHGFEPLIISEQPRISLVGYGPGDMRPRLHWPGVWY